MSRRVLEVLTSFDIGGTERQCTLLAQHLDPERFEVRLACLRREGGFLDPVARSGIGIEQYPLRNLWGLAAWRQRLRLARALRRERIDLVHTHGFYTNVFALPAARLVGVKAVASIRDLNDMLWSPRQRRVHRYVCRLADRIVVNAAAIRERLVAEGYDARRIAVVRNGIDAGPFDRPIPEATPASCVGVVGRLVCAGGEEIKGVRYFLEAAAALAPRRPFVQFLVAGDGPCRGELESLARRLGVAERVSFTGFQSDVPALLAGLTVFVLPSLTEGLSNSLLEAMAAGVPIVATRVGGNPELVADGEHGLLVPPRDAAALERAIEALLVDASLRERLGRAAAERARREFSIARMTAAMTAVYEELGGPP